MKNLMRLPAVIFGLVLILIGTTQEVKAQNEDVSLQSFYDELSPYGTWIQDPQYGYVWRPDVDQDDFRPYYSNGRWAMTEYGNTWVSNYDWGWAPFHYGRWIYNRYNNWIWIPDTVWGPAWVSWRSGGGYYGWAPLGPSVNINVSFGRGGYRVPDFCWSFIPQRNIYYNNFPRYSGYRNNVYIQNTVIINNTYVRNSRTYYTGPRAEEIRRATNQNVTVYNVNRSNRPGSRIENNTVNIYNPRPSRGDANNNGRPAPRSAVNADVRQQVIGRDNTVSARPSRGSSVNNQNQSGRDNSNNAIGRPSRGSDVNNQNQPGRDYNNNVNGRPSRGSEANRRNETTAAPNNDGRAVQSSRPGRFGRDNDNTQPQRTGDGSVDRSGNAQQQAQPQQQRPERTQQIPQRERVERRQPTQQVPQQRTQESRPAPQRMERAQPQQRMEQPPRTERSNGGGNQRESRGGGGSGRPTRG